MSSSGWVKVAGMGVVIGEQMVREDRHSNPILQIRLRSGDESAPGNCVYMDFVIAGKNVAYAMEIAKPGTKMFITGKLELVPRKDENGCDYYRVFSNSTETVEEIKDG